MYHSRAPRGLRVHHKDFGRAHQVDRDLFAEFQALRSHLLSGVRTIYGDSKRFRVERLRVDIRGELVSKVFQGYCLQTGCGSSTPAPTRRIKCSCPRALEEVSCRHGAVRACRQPTTKVCLGRIDVHRGVSGQQGAGLRDRHAVSAPNAARDGAGYAISSSHRYPGLRAHRYVIKNA